MPLYYVDLPLGAQRILLDAANYSHMRLQSFLGMLLTEAAAAVLDIEPSRKFHDLERSQNDQEKSEQGGGLEESTTVSKSQGTQGRPASTTAGALINRTPTTNAPEAAR